MQKNFEKLPPDSLTEQLLIRKEQLETLMGIMAKAIKSAPGGKLRITGNKGTIQYYHVTEKTNANGRYIPKNEIKFIKNLAQKDYDLKAVENAKCQINGIKELIQILANHDWKQIFANISIQREKLIETATLSDEEYAKLWLEEKYIHKTFSTDNPELFTAKGERVRSKSEVIIADTLGRLGIPYRYEYPIRLKRFSVYPDFYCLDVKSRKEFAWEHFGMMDKPEYAIAAVKKITAYEEAGFFPGKNLIITMETQGNPISSKIIEKIVKNL